MSKTDEDISTNIHSDANASQSLDAFVGKQIGKYEILARVAKGGTATVYQARDKILNRDVAIKILHEHLEQKNEVVERFKNEAQVVASLRHPNILSIYDFFSENGRTILVAEFMPGTTLSALIKTLKKVPENYVLMLGLEMLNGLKAAHEKGITHRDIKPANILIHSELGVKVSDFGLAKLKDADNGLTREGVFIGTPSFSSPEQIEGRPVDRRSDLFSLGLTLYMLATGTHAFKQKGDSTTTVWFKIVRGKFQAVRDIDPSLSPDFEKILARALQVDLDKRYQSAKEMADDVLALLKKRKVYPYQDELRTFLDKPVGAAPNPSHSSFLKILKFSALGLAIPALSALAYFFLPAVLVKEWWAAVTPESAKEQKIETTTPPVVIPKPIEPAVSIIEPKKVEANSSQNSTKPILPAVPKAFSGLRSEPFVLLQPKARVIYHRERKDFNLRIPFSVQSEFSLTRAASAGRKISEGKFQAGGFDWKDWGLGRFIWKAGLGAGEIEILDWDQYRSRSRGTKRELQVLSTFNETDLQINPWNQILRLSWESGAKASSYRLEIAEDAEFKKSIFSSATVTRFATIDRLWTKDLSLFWRVSYLDDTRNVFLVDPVRKINLKVFLTAPEFDLISPNPFESLKDGSVRVEGVGPSDAKVRCGEMSEAGPKKWQALESRAGLLSLEMKPTSDLIVCESLSNDEQSLFVIPLQL